MALNNPKFGGLPDVPHYENASCFEEVIQRLFEGKAEHVREHAVEGGEIYIST